jgi:hypothetical protein
LQEFWKRVEQNPPWGFRAAFPGFNAKLCAWSTITHGIPGFFRPNPLAHAGDSYVLGPERAGYYSTAPLQRTLEELVDFDLVNRCRPRLTVGAAHVRTSQIRYFDSRNCALSVSHVLASGALPPAFPAVRIGGELYWDGGALSNTPTEPVFDDNPRKDSLIFSVHLWNPTGSEPTTMAEVFNRHKDVQYSSRIATQIARQQQIHRLRHVINELAAKGCPRPSATARRCISWRAMAARQRCTSSACSRRSSIARPTPRTSISARAASRSAGMRVTHTPSLCSRAPHGSATSIRAPALSCTSRRGGFRKRRSDEPPIGYSALLTSLIRGSLASIRPR